MSDVFAATGVANTVQVPALSNLALSALIVLAALAGTIAARRRKSSAT